MNRRRRLLLGGLAVVAVLAVGLVALALIMPAPATAAPTAPDLTWQVLASGGQTVSSPSYTMLSTAGQPVAGPSSSANYTLVSGYWQSFQAAIRELFLPIVLAD